MINLFTRPLTRRKLAKLRLEREWLVKAAARARKGRSAVTHIQIRLTAITTQILRLEAKL